MARPYRDGGCSMILITRLKNLFIKFLKQIIKSFLPEIYNKVVLFDKLSMEINFRLSDFDKELQDLYEIVNNLSADELAKQRLSLIFENNLGYKLKFENPETFNEKLQWLKLNYRNPLMTKLADKYRVRQYVNEKNCGQYLNTLYGVYENYNDFKRMFDSLPNSFVLKVNHWSGDAIIVDDKTKFDWFKAEKLSELLNKNYYYHPVYINLDNKKVKVYLEEWPYKNIKPCLICERYLEDSEGKLLDYKIFCFHGKAAYIQVDVDRKTNHTRCFYNLNWQKQPFTTLYPLYKGEITKPIKLEEMISLAETLAEGFPHVRVDLYNIDDKEIIFGEMTFYHGSGLEKFDPMEWDLKLGKCINLDKI